MASFFHAYDLRGTYPDEIGEEEAERVGKAYGTWVDADTVLIARDGRKHGEKITSGLIEGINSTGTEVLNIGMVPSPVLYFASYRKDMHGAVVTASHNPPEYTGFKFAKPGALAVSREGGMAEIERIYQERDFESGEGSAESLDIAEDYVQFVSERIDLEHDLDVAVNFGNGVAVDIGRKVLESIGCDLEAVNDEVNGEFPNHLPDPTDEKAQEALKESITGEEDLGIIFDGDGDRAGFIVGDKYVKPDEVLSIFAEKSLELEKGNVIHDLRSSKLVKETIRQKNGKPVESEVGHTFISEKIHSDSHAVFAGELSGHYYFPALDVPWDDGIFAAALMCQIASETDLEAQIEAMPSYPVSPELRIDCPHDSKQHVVEAVEDKFSDHPTNNVDGVKIEFENGWALVRPSNTQPKMSVRCEADTEKDLDFILEQVESEVRNAIQKFS